MNTAEAETPVCEMVDPTRSAATLVDDAKSGLIDAPRTLPPKYFYDERGSELFDQICDAPEYYPTRTESALLQDVAARVLDEVRPDSIVELGSGTSRKTRHLFDACESLGQAPSYFPFDVCDEVLVSSAESLQQSYQWLDVFPMVGDYTAGLGNLPRREGRNLYVFLGGTIGNFSQAEAQDFLREVRACMAPDDALLIGADRVKDPDVLHAAYNDDGGVTAAFNLNLLNVLNRELDADFDPQAFEHYALFNPQESQIEMFLIAMREQRVRLGELDQVLEFREGDNIRTEISRKFTRERLENLLGGSGFGVRAHYESDGTKFSLVLADPV